MIEELIVNGQIYLGKQGENNIRMVKFREPILWNTTIGNGTCELIHTRCGDAESYKVTLEYADDCVIWKISTYDTACDGKGTCELRYIVDGAVVKAETYTTTVLPITAVVPDEDIPDIANEWVDKVLEAKARVEELCGDMDSKADNDLSNVANAVFKKKADESGVGGGSAEVKGAFKKIGFTSDCDYIATESDGYTAFNTAISEASDNDILIVMPGTYNGTQTLEIRKNLNFLGIGMPTINFPIYIYGEGREQFDGSEHTLIVPINVLETNWNGFKFNGRTWVYMAQEYAGRCINSKFNATNCIFTYSTSDSSNYINLLGYIKNCVIDMVIPRDRCAFGGCFGDVGSEFVDCDIFLYSPYQYELKAKGCNIYLLYTLGTYDYTYDYYDFENCNIYNPNNITLGDEYNYYSNKKAKNCNVFGSNPFTRAESCQGCMTYYGSAISAI